MLRSRIPQIVLNKKAAGRFDGKHPWVYAPAIVAPASPLDAGAVVDLVYPDGSWIARGIYNPSSRIRVRLYAWDPETMLDGQWFASRLARAAELRQRWMTAENTHFDAYRLVNSEGDGLSGVIIDRFGPYAVVHISALAMWQYREALVEWLCQEHQLRGVLLRFDAQFASQEGVEAFEQWVVGEPPSGPVVFEEHGVRVAVSLASGQKTGYYLDQRANRLRAARWMRGGSVLDVCCYAGGFSMAAAVHGRAEQVVAVDSSRLALEAAQRNAELNEVGCLVTHRADCFDFLQRCVQDSRCFDTVVLDPPKMAGHRQQVGAAIRAYHRLNSLVIQLLRPGGLLVSCSCSGRVSREEFVGVVAAAAKGVGRELQVLEIRGADCDHPVHSWCPESEYLKCVIARAW
ncbi:MAG: SAM-dependent methyltransferase [Pirellulaceae bacterium]|nr:MAG: SAM-dependent methyltransferase [Pirellulaceae bacterium]